MRIRAKYVRTPQYQITVHSEKRENGDDISGGGAGIPWRDLQISTPGFRSQSINKCQYDANNNLKPKTQSSPENYKSFRWISTG